MSESQPATVTTLARDLTALGVERGMTLLVHSSLRSMGYVCGGAVAVILALEEALGPDGTLVMPSHTPTMTEPAYWCNPPVPATWFERIRNETPPFDPQFTPSMHMGIIAETFRRREGALRSSHPHSSFVARGPGAHAIVGEHPLANALGEDSPLARLFERDAHVLLLGVHHDRNTSLHLAEHRADWDGKDVIVQGAPIVRDGKREWVTFDELDYDSTDFLRLGTHFEADTDFVSIGEVGEATARFMQVRPLVRYATEWMRRMRPGSLAVEDSLPV